MTRRFLALAMLLAVNLGAYAPPAAAQAQGRAAYATWGQSIWPVSVASAGGGSFRIHYVGWGAEWDETVGCDRLRRGGSGALAAEWHGAYYPASVIREDRQGTLIHYEGYDDSWNEVVPQSRLMRFSPICGESQRGPSVAPVAR